MTESKERLWPPPSASTKPDCRDAVDGEKDETIPPSPRSVDNKVSTPSASVPDWTDDDQPNRSQPVSVHRNDGRSICSRGVDVSSLRRLKDSNMPHPGKNLSTSSGHRQIKMDSRHVRMPYLDSPHRESSQGRWACIASSLENVLVGLDMHGPDAPAFLKNVICRYNESYADKWDFSGLEYFIDAELKTQEKRDFWSTIDKMGKLAAELPRLCPEPIPLLKKHEEQTLTLSQHQIACLLANAFFCTFPYRNQKYSPKSDTLPLPSINFSGLYKWPRSQNSLRSQMNKIRCIMHYFKRVTSERPQGCVTFARHVLTRLVDWKACPAPFMNLCVTSAGNMESGGKGMLQVDFANKFVGGGVLGRGCVQEEIQFLVFTEMIVSRLFTEQLEDKECLIMTGCEQYSSYRGYSDSFEWLADFRDSTQRDRHRRRLSQVVAMDAKKFYNVADQFEEHNLERELNKAFCGFQSDRPDDIPAVATGNWGCGDFRGDHHLKSLIQLMAAAEARRDVCYFTCGNVELVNEMFDVFSLIRHCRLVVSDLWLIIEQYAKKRKRSDNGLPNLYRHILETFSNDQ